MKNTKIVEILMAEDDEGDALMTKEALAEAKVANRLHLVSDGEQAIEFLQKKGSYINSPTPDMILLDLNMPRMNGYEVLDWVKNHQTFKRIPVVILTTSDSEQDVIKSYDNRANCFITKPVDLKQFMKVVQYIDEFWMGIVRLPLNQG